MVYAIATPTLANSTGAIIKTIRRIAMNLISFDMARRYFVDSTWLDKASILQVGIVLANRYTTCQRTSLTKRC
jgi:hypothetical protein